MADGELSWQNAVATLARERTLAEVWGGVLKKYGEPAAQARGSIAYGEAKAEYDGVIAGLGVALARRGEPASLDDLQARLQRAFDKREAFCRSVEPLVPATAGEKDLIVDIVRGAVTPLVEAVVAIWSRVRDDDALTRKTIQTQLEATSWPEFNRIPPQV